MAAHSNLNQPSALRDMHEAVSAWFLGPRAENFDVVKKLFNGVLDRQAEVRKRYHEHDEDWITTTIKESAVYKSTIDDMTGLVDAMSELLNLYSVPFFSPRYIGHMCMEMSVPAIMGWIITLMHNPNNVAFEASPITTILELEVGKQLCEMLGYQFGTTPETEPWGHIACDGTIANMESMWAARNLKLYPLALRSAIDDGMLRYIGDSFEITTAGPAHDVKPKLFTALTDWELLNLPTKEILDITDRLHTQYGISAKYIEDALQPYLCQSEGKEKMFRRFNIDPDLPPQYFVSATKHYSWPKAAALVGIGSNNCHNVPVDNHARINVTRLRDLLDQCIQNQQAVYAVVAIVGSTEEGVVDPLDEIVALRDEYQKKGLTFLVHADAAWGGYFASMVRDPPANFVSRWDDEHDADGSRDFVPSLSMRHDTVKQFHALAEADSITIDPHKAGYIPYPAGGLCYRDGRMRYLLTWTAPYLHDSSTGESIGIYGIEGSKPGAPAVACWLHNTLVGLHKEGHGGLLGEVAFTCRRFSAHWAAMSDDSTPYVVVPFNPLVHDGDPEEERKEKEFIRARILAKNNQEIVQDPEAMNELCALGSDLNINAFACNFRIDDRLNEDVEDANYLNNRVFDRLSVTHVWETPYEVPLFLSSTVFGQHDYDECLRNYQRRLGLETHSRQDLFVLRNVCMSPFQGVSDGPGKIAKTFEDILKEETQVALDRATISPQEHSFVVQGDGSSEIFLVYQPLFHKANGRSQLILSAKIAESNLAAYKEARKSRLHATFTCRTAEHTTLDHLTKSEKLDVKIESDRSFWTGNEEMIEAFSMDASFSNIKIIKQRTLESRWRDLQYPENNMPFYLYGTPEEQHIEHMLLRAPNAQITLESVKLDVAPALTKEQLARGAILQIDRPERALQPPSADNDPKNMFKPGRKFKVVIVEDTNPAEARGPGLAKAGKQLAQGTVELGESLYIDWTAINTQDFTSGRPRVMSLVSSRADQTIKNEWHALVSDFTTPAPVSKKE